MIKKKIKSLRTSAVTNAEMDRTKLNTFILKNWEGEVIFLDDFHGKWKSILLEKSDEHSFDKFKVLTTHYFSSHHSFSFRTCSSSLGVKSFLMLKVLRISSGVFPLIIFATVLQVTSSKPLISK